MHLQFCSSTCLMQQCVVYKCFFFRPSSLPSTPLFLQAQFLSLSVNSVAFKVPLSPLPSPPLPHSSLSSPPSPTLPSPSCLLSPTLPSPPTLLQRTVCMGGNNVAVTDVECLNCWNAIYAVQAGRHYIARVQGQPINTVRQGQGCM